MDGLTKLCTGPAHVGPTRVPLDEQHWNFHRSGKLAGKPVARCKLCVNWGKLVEKGGPHGFTSAAAMRPFARELVDRCGGYVQVERAHGIREETLRSIATGKQAKVQKRTAARILVAISEQRKLDRRNGASPRFLAARKAQADREQRLQRLAGY